MAITYPFTLPVSQGFTSVDIRPVSVVGMFASEFTGTQQTYAHPGQFLTASVSFPPMKREDAAGIVAALMSTQGTRGTFYFGDPQWTSPRGIGTGTPLVSGASQTGQDLITDGWTISQTGIMKAGDWVQVGSGSTQQLCMVLADADSDGSGNATLSLFPRIRTAFADNTSLTVSSPTGVWRLMQAIDFGQQLGAITQLGTIQFLEAF
jgi:hypothetical protein